jgi:hypothetical protein
MFLTRYLSDRAYVKRKSAPIMKRIRPWGTYFWPTNEKASSLLKSLHAQIMLQHAQTKQPIKLAMDRAWLGGLVVYHDALAHAMHEALTHAGFPVAVEGSKPLGLGNVTFIDT